MSKKKMFQIGSSLTKALEETVAVANDYAGKLQIEVIPLKKIEVDPANPRELLIDFTDIVNGVKSEDPMSEHKQTEMESLRSMAESIKREGVINPIVVYKHEAKYRLIAGERRALASLMAGKDYIQAKILDKKPSEQKLRLLQWVENVEREGLSLWERLKNLEQLIDAFKTEQNITKEMSPSVLSQVIGCSVQNAMNYCFVLNLDDKVLKEAIKENKIRNLEKAAFISQINDNEKRGAAIKKCINGATLRQLKEVFADSGNNKKGSCSQRKREGYIDLGRTNKISVVKALVNSVLQTEKYGFLKKEVAKMSWCDPKAAAAGFKKILFELEKNE